MFIDVRSKKRKDKITDSKWTKMEKLARKEKKMFAEQDLNTEEKSQALDNQKVCNDQFKKAYKAILWCIC